jgi:hypothetical protein
MNDVKIDVDLDSSADVIVKQDASSGGNVSHEKATQYDSEKHDAKIFTIDIEKSNDQQPNKDEQVKQKKSKKSKGKNKQVDDEFMFYSM